MPYWLLPVSRTAGNPAYPPSEWGGSTDVPARSDRRLGRWGPIHYEIHGNGSPALVFVHGWCCDRRSWDGQVQAFAPRHTVVALDLAGHGASGRERASWTIQAFGLDVTAVVEKLGLRRVVLIGHSLGGGPIVEAVRRSARGSSV